MKVLVVIDMQKDFTTGVLGNPETAAVTEPVAAYIRKFRTDNPDSTVIATLDTHTEDYMNTQEGKFLPVVHCVRGTDGWMLEQAVTDALGTDSILLEKPSFGSVKLPQTVSAVCKGEQPEEITLVGVCTDICVISNAMILKAAFPEVPLRVIPECCAGVTPQSHDNALSAMRACQIITE